MWTKWFPWRFVIRRMAQSQGFLDPFNVLTKLSRFAQPSKVTVPGELVRAGVVFHARGLMNSQAIQHNLDWVWPYWVVQQFDPKGSSFVPRAFSLTHINLTHRNWTAVGLPGFSGLPIVDPRGLVTPFWDGWSIDAWILTPGQQLIPSRLKEVHQSYGMNEHLHVLTRATSSYLNLETHVEVIEEQGTPTCLIRAKGVAPSEGWLVISLRPYNPEGVSFIHHIAWKTSNLGWHIDGKYDVMLSEPPERRNFSHYRQGDVYHFLPQGDSASEMKCDVGMATAAALYELKPHVVREIEIKIPLDKENSGHGGKSAVTTWKEALRGGCELKIPDARIKAIFDEAVWTLILHTPDENTYPGPYTYKHFWFRDAAFILHALTLAGFTSRAEKVLDGFRSRQTPFGHFRSQDGEWDSNGQALWILDQYCKLTGAKPKPEWRNSIERGGRWIEKKRVRNAEGKIHNGLLPAGFSAEHLGPNDYYYWDDFWGVAGLRCAADLMDAYGETQIAADFRREADAFNKSLDQSLAAVEKRLGSPAVPASPYRRMDTGAIGSLAGGYPLRLWKPHDKRLMASVEFLIKECFVHGGFFHDMSHSGINPYLTIHVAQILLRAGDQRFLGMVRAISELATSTGQWPEAIHPATKGGCMGDGQHVWASAEWVIMLRNCFVREEGDALLFCTGIPEEWLKSGEIFLGPTLTPHGPVTIYMKKENEKIQIHWEAQWRSSSPEIRILMPGYDTEIFNPQEKSAVLRRGVKAGL